MVARRSTALAPSWVAILAIIGIIYGALIALMQTNVKRPHRLFLHQPP